MLSVMRDCLRAGRVKFRCILAVYALSFLTILALYWSSNGRHGLYQQFGRTENELRAVPGHYSLNDTDQFVYRTSKQCSILDLLRSVDPSLDSVDPDLFCDAKAKNTDLACRWFFRQIGMNDIHDPKLCMRTGSQAKVPKIVYYVIFGTYTFEFRHYVSVVSARRFINPSAIYVIGDCHPTGPWWKQVMRDVSGLRFIYREKPEAINGKKVKWNHHLSDVVRLQIIYANGGIYLDTDMVVTRPVEALLDYGITLGLLDNGTGMGNAFICAKRGSTFVRKWYESYQNYNNTEYYRNSLQVPRDMWHADPASIHMESERLYRPNWYEREKLFLGNDYPWRESYAVHMWSSKLFPKGFEDTRKLNTTLGQIFRHVLYGSSDIR